MIAIIKSNLVVLVSSEFDPATEEIEEDDGVLSGKTLLVTSVAAAVLDVVDFLENVLKVMFETVGKVI